jgi:hypothetical protein
MKKMLILRTGAYDFINETYWPADLMRKITPTIDEAIATRHGRRGRYYFDESDKCVWFVPQLYDNEKRI